jgi:hypothetical protein
VEASFTSFSAALNEVADARIFSGIHFRAACADGQATGEAIGAYIIRNSIRPMNGNHSGQVRE